MTLHAGPVGAHWDLAGRRMLAKALGELSYEELLRPVPIDRGYRISLPGGIDYEFTARRGAFDSWHVDPGSICRRSGGSSAPATDPLRFLAEAYDALGIPGTTAGHLIRELGATLLADTRILESGSVDLAAMADVGYAELEGMQTGHPWLIPNKGRMGFSASDAERFAPESRNPVRLPWMAVHHSIASYRGVPGLDAGVLLAAELPADHRDRFAARLAERGCGTGPFHWLPVHPWQWDHVVLPVFGADVAAGRIVLLGDGPDHFLPQQSIRTFSNIDSPQRHHVKLPLSIFNTLVWRGLPTERTRAAPAVTAWVLGLAENDPFLRDETRVVLLGEVASVTVDHPVLDCMVGVPYQYRELLGAIWREPIHRKLAANERARTLAGLLHVDPEGRPFVGELVRRSGLSVENWLRALCTALLPPLLHFLYRYGVVFSPHGENAIVVFDERDVPARLAVKDFVDDVNVSAVPLPELETMPPDVAEILLTEPPAMLCQFIQCGLFVGHFRYLADIVETRLAFPEQRFWDIVRDEVLAYQERFPEYAERFELFDLLGPDLDRLCLNRNRLLVDGYGDRPERPHAVVHGRIPNPLHRK